MLVFALGGQFVVPASVRQLAASPNITQGVVGGAVGVNFIPC